MLRIGRASGWRGGDGANGGGKSFRLLPLPLSLLLLHRPSAPGAQRRRVVWGAAAERRGTRRRAARILDAAAVEELNCGCACSFCKREGPHPEGRPAAPDGFDVVPDR